MFVRMRALAPTPVAGPESDQSTRKWSVNCSWLPRTSRNANTSSRGRWIVVVETMGFMCGRGSGEVRRVWQDCDKVSTHVSQSGGRAPRVPRAEARRRIVEGAGRLLAPTRFRDLTVDAVMLEAGLARTLFYRHFDGLPHLVLGLLDDLIDATARDAATAPDLDHP